MNVQEQIDQWQFDTYDEINLDPETKKEGYGWVVGWAKMGHSEPIRQAISETFKFDNVSNEYWVVIVLVTDESGENLLPTPMFAALDKDEEVIANMIELLTDFLQNNWFMRPTMEFHTKGGIQHLVHGAPFWLSLLTSPGYLNVPERYDQGKD